MSAAKPKIALVTGSGRGIGRATALALARAGFAVALTARSHEEIESVRDEIAGIGGHAVALRADLARDDEIDALVAGVERQLGGIDVLVNNAGWGRKATVVRADPSDWDQTFRVNLRAPMLLARLVLPRMIQNKGGGIVNVGSISGKSGEAGSSAYAASKFGLIGFTQSLFEEVREHGIKVGVLLPGFVDTSMIPPVKHIDRAKMIRAEDVAAAVLFVLNSPPGSCPVEITLRPQRTPYR